MWYTRSAFISSLKPLSTSGSAPSAPSLCRLFVFKPDYAQEILMHTVLNTTVQLDEYAETHGRTLRLRDACETESEVFE